MSDIEWDTFDHRSADPVQTQYRTAVPVTNYETHTTRITQAAHDAAIPSLDELHRIDSLTNPKASAATRDQKAPLDLLEPAADELIARVLAHGAAKYGKMNYKTIPIYLSVYLAATKRHVNAMLAGEDLDPDSGLPHWAHVGANVHVVLSLLGCDNLIDDRGPAERTEEQEARSSASNRPR